MTNRGGLMKNAKFQKYEMRASIIKAMAHPTRLLIIDELSKRERCVGEITNMVGADTSTVSKHLLVLKNAGLITDEKRSKMVYYSLSCSCIPRFISCIESVIKEREQNQIFCTINRAMTLDI
jgi:ArsR family transcriptional regulator, arsenate/arsenite/antimonite-responsive transcriptional repressor